VSDSALRALTVLEQLASSPGMTSSELARELRMSRATVARLVASLSGAGWIVPLEGDKRYATSLRLVSVASAALSNHSIRSSLLPWLMELCERTGLHCALCFYEAGTLTVTDVADPSEAGVRTHVDGRKYPAACTAGGKILLSLQTEEEIERVATAGLSPFTEFTRRTPEEIHEDVRKSLAQGFGISDREFAVRASGLAVPVFDRYDRPIAALTVNVTGPITHEFIASVAPVARGVASRASLALGNPSGDLLLA
jgi:DNA-binding IclR family transcriptional regulator